MNFTWIAILYFDSINIWLEISRNVIARALFNHFNNVLKNSENVIECRNIGINRDKIHISLHCFATNNSVDDD